MGTCGDPPPGLGEQSFQHNRNAWGQRQRRPSRLCRTGRASVVSRKFWSERRAGWALPRA